MNTKTTKNTRSTHELRKLFLDYFSSLQHTVVPSSALIPNNDSTLLFTNAGMVQFKDVFLGKEKRPYIKATSVQRCMRAGGKHNDLENVGYTARHHTFFEMLGNFSFGNYFKREAIQHAWGFLTGVLQLHPEKLWVTVYKEDEEAAHIWLKEIKIDPQRFSYLDKEDNFWSMGDTGPCGPCSEIFYDHGPDIQGGPPGSVDADGDRYVEIWNLVFMQFDRDTQGQLTPLPKPSVDTGMGLERIAAVMQGVTNNYDIDLFKNIIQVIKKLPGFKNSSDNSSDSSIRVLADHIRSVAFLISDGILPSNEGRGYVLRRIIRRAVRHGNKLGFRGPFFYQLVMPLIKEMGEAYTDLQKNKILIEDTIKKEEEDFARTLEQGLKILDQKINNIINNIIPGATVFLLYDTYGFPPDLTADIARERSLVIDQEGFDKAMAKQRELSQDSSKFSSLGNFAMDFSQLNLFPTVFTGYNNLNLCEESQVIALFREGELVNQLNTEEKGVVILDRTPFYAESGGQIGDQGEIGCFAVTDTQKQGDFYLHYGSVKKNNLKINDKVKSQVNKERRQAIQLNHSATHLLHAALRKLLGEQVVQKGSLVMNDRLRFDFSYSQALTDEQKKIIETEINKQIRANVLVETKIMFLDKAKEEGVLALFGEKYAEQVRVLSMGEYSKELCGGTHVKHTGDIGLFKIISEAGVAAGIRRIEAVTGHYALVYMQILEGELEEVIKLFKADRNNFRDKLVHVLEHNRQLEKDMEKLQYKNIYPKLDKLITEKKNIAGVNILATDSLHNLDAKTLRAGLDDLRQKLQSGVLVLASVKDGKIALVSSVSQDLVERIHAGELLGYVASQIGGKAGGRADMAQGGGSDIQALTTALKSVYTWVEKKLCL